MKRNKAKLELRQIERAAPKCLLGTAEADILSRTFPAVARQPIELESFSNSQRYGKSSSFELRNWEVSNLRFFVDDVIIRVGLGFLAQVIAPWAPTPRGNFLFRFLQKTTRKSAFLEPMVGILALVVCKLCPKSNKLYN